MTTITPEQKAQEEKCQKALDKVKISLLKNKDALFFSTILFALRQRMSWNHPTAATDGLSIYYNPAWFLKLTPAQQIFLVLHEVLHVAYMHMGRLGNRNQKVFNWAADYVINLELVNRGYSMPDGGLLDTAYAGMGAEQVYDKLMQKMKNNEPMPQNGIGEDLMPPPPGTSEQEIQEKVKQILVQAATKVKMENLAPGAIPGDLGIQIDNLVNPKLSWQRILSRYYQETAKNDYSWTKPNRRYFPDEVFPTLHSTGMISLAIFVDTSGSVTDGEFSHMVKEMESIFKMCKPESITLIQFDTRVRTVTKLKNLRDLAKCTFTGRGGTRVEQVFEWIQTNKPQLSLIFTDGGFYFPEHNFTRAQQSRTLWLIHNNPQWESEFGKTLHYEIAYS
jgi:predicted metal-dependent peptidase